MSAEFWTAIAAIASGSASFAAWCSATAARKAIDTQNLSQVIELMQCDMARKNRRIVHEGMDSDRDPEKWWQDKEPRVELVEACEDVCWRFDVLAVIHNKSESEDLKKIIRRKWHPPAKALWPLVKEFIEGVRDGRKFCDGQWKDFEDFATGNWTDDKCV